MISSETIPIPPSAGRGLTFPSCKHGRVGAPSPEQPLSLARRADGAKEPVALGLGGCWANPGVQPHRPAWAADSAWWEEDPQKCCVATSDDRDGNPCFADGPAHGRFLARGVDRRRTPPPGAQPGARVVQATYEGGDGSRGQVALVGPMRAWPTPRPCGGALSRQ